MKNFRRVSKLFVTGVKDFLFNKDLELFLKEYPISGIALFNSPHDSPSNIWSDREGSLEAVYDFAREIHSRGIFLSCDQEGGRVRRLRGAFVNLPSAQKISEASDEGRQMPLIRQLYSLAARQMALTGIQVNFAPVCDIRTSQSSAVVGDRSFGSSIDEILSFIQVFCEAFQEEGVHTTLKHFPGHGPTTFDSHERVATLFKPKSDLIREDLQVFRQAQDFASAIMTAHIAFEDDPERIVSLDAKLQAELRTGFAKRLAWFTDDIQTMKAVAEKQPWIQAFDCLYDYLLLCGTLDQASKSIEETIRYAEASCTNFQKETDLEKRLERSASLFSPDGALLKFEMWKSKILEYETKAQEIIEKLQIH